MNFYCASYNTCKDRRRITSNGDDSNDDSDNDNEDNSDNNKDIDKIIVIIVVSMSVVGRFEKRFSCICRIFSTNTSAALTLLRTHGFTSARVGVSRIAVFVTESNSADAAATQEQADLTRRAGISIMAVAVGSWLDMNELRRMVSYPSDRNTLKVDSYESLGSVVPTLKQSTCGSE